MTDKDREAAFNAAQDWILKTYGSKPAVPVQNRIQAFMQGYQAASAESAKEIESAKCNPPHTCVTLEDYARMESERNYHMVMEQSLFESNANAEAQIERLQRVVMRKKPF